MPLGTSSRRSPGCGIEQFRSRDLDGAAGVRRASRDLQECSVLDVLYVAGVLVLAAIVALVGRAVEKL
jgi:hypothetical protein